MKRIANGIDAGARFESSSADDRRVVRLQDYISRRRDVPAARPGSDTRNGEIPPPAVTTCQVCGRAMKTRDGRIIRHGWRVEPAGLVPRRRPTPCQGAGWPPFEEARDAIAFRLDCLQDETFLAMCRIDRAAAAAEIARLQARCDEWARRNGKAILVRSGVAPQVRARDLDAQMEPATAPA